MLLAVHSFPRIDYGGIKLHIDSLGTFIAFTNICTNYSSLLFCNLTPDQLYAYMCIPSTVRCIILCYVKSCHGAHHVHINNFFITAR